MDAEHGGKHRIGFRYGAAISDFHQLRCTHGMDADMAELLFSNGAGNIFSAGRDAHGGEAEWGRERDSKPQRPAEFLDSGHSAWAYRHFVRFEFSEDDRHPE